MEAFGFAIEDATKAIELNPGYVKVYRLSSAALEVFLFCLHYSDDSGVLPKSHQQHGHHEVKGSPERLQNCC